MVKSLRVVIPKPNSVILEEVEVPEPRDKEVLIRTQFCLISSGTELTAFTGSFPERSRWSEYVKYPFYPGYSNVGIVEKVGEEVENIREGDIVASQAPHSEYVIVREDQVVRVPEGVALEEATFHTIASGVMHSVRLAGVTLGSTVVILGLGLLGQMATQFSRLCGAYPLIGVDLYENRLKLGKESGATHVINSRKEDVYERVKDITEGRMADIVFEVTGNPQVISWGIKLVRTLGRFIVLSSPRGPTAIDFHDEVNAPSRIIMGTHFSSQPLFETPYYPWTRKRNVELFFRLLLDGIVRVRHLITHVVSLEDVEKAYELLLNKKNETLAVVLDLR